MVKIKKYFLNPISRQNFANAFAETPNLNLEVRLKMSRDLESWMFSEQKIIVGPQEVQDPQVPTYPPNPQLGRP